MEYHYRDDRDGPKSLDVRAKWRAGWTRDSSCSHGSHGRHDTQVIASIATWCQVRERAESTSAFPSGSARR